MNRILKRTAYREAAALLRADMDDADLNCESTLSEEEASEVREYIRSQIAEELEKKG